MSKFLSGNDFLYIGLGIAALYAAIKLTKPVTDLTTQTSSNVTNIEKQITDVTQATSNLTSDFLNGIDLGLNQSEIIQTKLFNFLKAPITWINNVLGV